MSMSANTTVVEHRPSVGGNPIDEKRMAAIFVDTSEALHVRPLKNLSKTFTAHEAAGHKSEGRELSASKN